MRDSEKIEEGANTTEFVVDMVLFDGEKIRIDGSKKDWLGWGCRPSVKLYSENGHYEECVVNDVLPNICKGNARIPIFHF